MSHIPSLLERHAVMNGIRNRLAQPGFRPGQVLENGTAYGPCLILSREYGSGGRWLARRVGEELGWEVFDREVVDQVSAMAHVRRQLIEGVDEHVRSFLDQTFDAALTGMELTDEQYLFYLRQVILSLGRQGNVVIVGRGAQFMLPPGCGLKVRLVAPLEIRIQRVADLEGISFKAAHAKVVDYDKARKTFIWKTFKAIASSPLNYDMVINTSSLDLESAAELVIATLKRRLRPEPVAMTHAV